MNKNHSIGTKTALTVIFSMIIIYHALAQDVLYLKDNSKIACSVLEFTKDQIRYVDDPNDTKSKKIDKSKLVLALFDNGSFMTFPNEYKGTQPPPENKHPDDWILTKDGQILKCKILNYDKDPIIFEQAPEGVATKYYIPRAKVLALLFAGGQKQLLGNSPKDVAAVLRDDKVPDAATMQTMVYVETPVDTVKKERSLGPELDLDQASYAQFKTKALQKTADLGRYLNLIANKSTDRQEADKAIELAIGLFINEDATVEITTSGAENKIRQKIRDYLVKLKLLKYSKVEIEWTDISYVSNLRRGPDGFYYGVISLQQTFRGYLEDKLIYSDVTRKNVEVILKTYRKEVEGESIELWDVFLSDIGISQQKG
jgi:hypothetical protein